MPPDTFVLLIDTVRLVGVDPEALEEPAVQLADVPRAVFPAVHAQAGMLSYNTLGLIPVAFSELFGLGPILIRVEKQRYKLSM